MYKRSGKVSVVDAPGFDEGRVHAPLIVVFVRTRYQALLLVHFKSPVAAKCTFL